MVPSSRHLLRARDLIDARYGEPLEVGQLAHVACSSPAHFSRRFAKEFGTPPHRYLISRRIERARHLLSDTEASILEVGLAVGFESAASFSRAFRRVVGVSPRAYRRVPASPAPRGVPTCVLMAWTRPVLEVSRHGQESRERDD